MLLFLLLLICRVDGSLQSNGTLPFAEQFQFAMALDLSHDLSSKTSTVTLNDGNTMPVFGLGVYLAQANGEAEQAVLWALKHGYRLIDTAAIYK